MIGGGIRGRLAGLLAAASMSAMACMPDLGQQRGFSLARGSGVVTSAPGMKRKPKRDSERQMRAVLKRRRKDAKRREDMARCHLRNPCLWWIQGQASARKWVAHGC